jgi:hypothetical protein
MTATWREKSRNTGEMMRRRAQKPENTSRAKEFQLRPFEIKTIPSAKLRSLGGEVRFRTSVLGQSGSRSQSMAFGGGLVKKLGRKGRTGETKLWKWWMVRQGRRARLNGRASLGVMMNAEVTTEARTRASP